LAPQQDPILHYFLGLQLDYQLLVQKLAAIIRRHVRRNRK
jgi:hypothetical protein